MKVMKSFTKLAGGDLNSCVKYNGAWTDASNCRIIAAFCFLVLLEIIVEVWSLLFSGMTVHACTESRAGRAYRLILYRI
jgi:hypothetical protein